MAYLGLFCLLVSLVLFWVGIAQVLHRRLRVADLLWLGLYGAGVLLYAPLIGVLRP
jgi:NADH:ubiquinone oxidoreductase subunit K